MSHEKDVHTDEGEGDEDLKKKKGFCLSTAEDIYELNSFTFSRKN